MTKPSVVLVGTLDTKGDEYAFLRDRLQQAGVDTLLVDVGTFPSVPSPLLNAWRSTPSNPSTPTTEAAVAATGSRGRVLGVERRAAAVWMAIQRTEPFAPLRGNR